MIDKLIVLANKLDKVGLSKEADLLDDVLKIASQFEDEITEDEIQQTEKEKEQARAAGIESEYPVYREEDDDLLMDAQLGDNPKMLISLRGKTYVDDDGNVYAEDADILFITEDAAKDLEEAESPLDVSRSIMSPGQRSYLVSDRKKEILDLFKKL